MKSIRYTLIKRITLIMVITFISVMSSISYLNLQTSRENLSITEKYIRDSLINNGLTLADNNSYALQEMVLDNAFSAVQKLVSATVQNNKNIIYGIFMDAENRAWTVANKDNPQGQLDEVQILDDDLSLWAASLLIADYRSLQKHDIEGYEFAAAIIVDGERLGVIRYAFSTRNMQMELEKVELLAEQSLRSTLYVISVLSLFALIFSYIATNYIATKITRPLSILSRAASRISEGDYETAINIQSDNEIGLLSNGIETMRSRIKLNMNELLEHQEKLNLNNKELLTTQNKLQDLNLHLEDKVNERTVELESAQHQLVDAARSAGMAEIAINVLHNLGNVINGVKISNQHSLELLRTSKVYVFEKTNELLFENKANIAEYLSHDVKGKKIPEFYSLLCDQLINENKSLQDNFKQMEKSIESICDIISSQQKHAKAGGVLESLNITNVIDEVLNIQMESLKKDDISIERNYKGIPDFFGDNIKVHQIFTNIIINGKHAVLANEKENRNILITIYSKYDCIYIEIKDNGIGLESNMIDRVFSHGYTTKSEGHGFGLHSCANLLAEMNGKITVESEGLGKGANFCVVLPTVNAIK